MFTDKRIMADSVKICLEHAKEHLAHALTRLQEVYAENNMALISMYANDVARYAAQVETYEHMLTFAYSVE